MLGRPPRLALAQQISTISAQLLARLERRFDICVKSVSNLRKTGSTLRCPTPSMFYAGRADALCRDPRSAATAILDAVDVEVSALIASC